MGVAGLLLSAVLLQAPPAKETIEIPGTKIALEMVRLPGGPGLGPFLIGAKEIAWAEFNPYGNTRRATLWTGSPVLPRASRSSAASTFPRTSSSPAGP